MAAIETTDRVSHMMWRLIDPQHPMYDQELAAKYGDSIEKVYRRADDLVGKLQAEAAAGTPCSWSCPTTASTRSAAR